MGKLFEPTTEAINNKIAAIAKDKGIKNPWIGIHHLHDEKRTVFASDKTTVEWINWDAHEPNYRNDMENCVHLYSNERTEYSCFFSWIGNSYCEDGNNDKECYWDGGDCCGDNVKTVNSYGLTTCTTCECIEPNSDFEQCNYKQINNGICNDVNNNKDCFWDGGDCCGDNVVMAECSSCECLEPFRWNDDDCDEFRRFICEKKGTG